MRYFQGMNPLLHPLELRSPGSRTASTRYIQSTRRNEGLLDVAFVYGLPGKPDYIYRRPFDYFNFEFVASTENVFESILTHGLLAGKEYRSGTSYDGVWGLYGSYDYIAPDVFRISTTAVSMGTTAQWRLPGPVTMQGTLLGGVGYGAGGTLEGTAADRDYHYGLTPQSLIGVRFVFGKVASLDLAARGYRITTILSTQIGVGRMLGARMHPSPFGYSARTR